MAEQSYQLDETSVRRVDAAVRRVLGNRQAAGTSAATPRGYAETIFARLASQTDDKWAWAEVYPVGDGTWTEKEGGRSGTSTERYAIEVEVGQAAVGDVVMLRRSAARPSEADPQPCWVIVPGRSGLFAVDVESDGGAAGDRDTACSYTYTVTSLAGVELGATMSPAWARPLGAMDAGTHGTAYYSDGSLILYQVDEVPQTSAECAEETP